MMVDLEACSLLEVCLPSIFSAASPALSIIVSISELCLLTLSIVVILLQIHL